MDMGWECVQKVFGVLWWLEIYEKANKVQTCN